MLASCETRVRTVSCRARTAYGAADGKCTVVAPFWHAASLGAVEVTRGVVGADAGCRIDAAGREAVGTDDAEAGGAGADAEVAARARWIGLFARTTGRARLSGFVHHIRKVTCLTHAYRRNVVPNAILACGSICIRPLAWIALLASGRAGSFADRDLGRMAYLAQWRAGGRVFSHGTNRALGPRRASSRARLARYAKEPLLDSEPWSGSNSPGRAQRTLES